jgi:hypothetical protein
MVADAAREVAFLPEIVWGTAWDNGSRLIAG